MAKIERFQIIKFESEVVNSTVGILVPEGSVFLKVAALHDGIYAMYAVPELVTMNREDHLFYVVRPQESIPADARFIDILTVIVEIPQIDKETGQQVDLQQGVVMYPIFRKEAGKIVKLN